MFEMITMGHLSQTSPSPIAKLILENVMYHASLALALMIMNVFRVRKILHFLQDLMI